MYYKAWYNDIGGKMQECLFGVYCHIPRVASATSLQCSGAAGVEYRGRQVMCITTGTIYSSVAQASACTGVSASSIVNCCRGRAITAGRMKWSYASHLPRSVIVRIKSRKGDFSEHVIVGL